MRIQKIRESKTVKGMLLYAAISMVVQTSFPTVTLALTSGPTQPEVQSFTPVGTSEMVNLFTGDFNYNIPLLDVGGYPLNISYSAGPGMEEEASWVGLGWNLNPGVINRSMRGLPDDFNGDEVVQESHLKASHTGGVSVGGSFEILGADALSLGLNTSFQYNNYTGWATSFSASPSLSLGESNKNGMTANLGVSLSASSSGVMSISPSVGLSRKGTEGQRYVRDIGGKLGLSFNTVQGLQEMNFGVSAKGEGKQIGKNDMGSGDGDLTGSWSFSTPTYTPKANNKLVNFSATFNVKLGPEIVGTNTYFNAGGFYSGQWTIDKPQKFPAYGYLYAQNAPDEGLMDFNREKDGEFGPHTTSLPITNFTYDIFNVSGQGIGGMYRPFRNDIGMVHDPETRDGVPEGGDVALSLEFGAGNAAKVGTDVMVHIAGSNSGPWKKNNEMRGRVPFSGKDQDEPLYEPWYFKQAGEINAQTDSDFYEEMGGDDAVYVKLEGNGVVINKLSDTLKNDGNRKYVPKARRAGNERQIRNQPLAILTGKQAAKFGVDHLIREHEKNNFELEQLAPANWRYKSQYLQQRDADVLIKNKSEHISEIGVVRQDGARYIYGIPAYNLFQEEVSFAVQGSNWVDGRDKAWIQADAEDASVDNSNGKDHFYSRSSTPAYAHSFLLSSILSADYADVDGVQGPSDGDYGTYTRFNYSKSGGFQWRLPFEGGDHNEGFRSKDDDDKANYLYGKKDVWHVHSIETKTHVAEFELAQRKDARGVSGEHDPNFDGYAQCLKEIRLYSKRDKIENGANAVPLKTVHFDYDYSLCPGVPNNDGTNSEKNAGGKLTLKKIWFTYENSERGVLSPYEFVYADPDHDGTMNESSNPSYDPKGVNRWGTYSKAEGGLTNTEYPYANQDKAKADLYAGAWSLSQVNLPSGASILVDYESDDYAFVQDKKAMEMVKILNVGNSKNYAEAGSDTVRFEDEEAHYLFFELKEPISGTQADADAYVQSHYGEDQKGKLIEDLYFRFYLDLDIEGHEAFEYISNYGKIDEIGAQTNPDGGLYRYGYVRMHKDKVHKTVNKYISPVTHAGWQTSRLYFPELGTTKDLLAKADMGEWNGLGAFTQKLMQVWTNIAGLANTERKFFDHNMSKDFEVKKSWIRLYSPDEKKMGGGYRVKQITLNDNWGSMGSGASSTYGQVYDYSNASGSGSSGVAAYEPLLGGDENPWKQPDFKFDYDDKKLKIGINNKYVTDGPYGESFFPSPTVGYGRVTVQNLHADGPYRSSNGKVVERFYTARDYPTVVERTGMKTRTLPGQKALSFMKVAKLNGLAATEGFVVKLNDMHGKSRGTQTFAQGSDVPLTEVEYLYKTRGGYEEGEVNELDNYVKVVEQFPDGGSMVSKKQLGVDVDFVMDTRRSEFTNVGGGALINVDGFILGIIPIVLPTVWPQVTFEQSRFYSVSTTKVVHSHGILERVTASDEGAEITTTDNQAFDAVTGQVLLTKSNNHHGDPLYSFTYPAHWAYEGMGPAYRNLMAEFSGVDTDDLPEGLVHGDLVWYEKGSNANLAYVENRKITSTTSKLQLVDGEGELIQESGAKLTIVQSGRRNLSTTPIGEVTSSTSPVAGSNLEFNGVLASSATEYDDKRDKFCPCEDFEPRQQGGTDGFEGEFLGWQTSAVKYGLAGFWRPRKTHVYQTQLKQSLTAGLDMRTDGTYADFVPFWQPPSGSGELWEKSNAPHWVWYTEVSLYSPFGTEIENRDTLGRYSAALFGYHHTLPTAITSNSRYKDAAFDNFEDYDGSCSKEHFYFIMNEEDQEYRGAHISNRKSHSGRRSIAVPPKKKVRAIIDLGACEQEPDAIP